jgi:hypothetical protein
MKVVGIESGGGVRETDVLSPSFDGPEDEGESEGELFVEL